MDGWVRSAPKEVCGDAYGDRVAALRQQPTRPQGQEQKEETPRQGPPSNLLPILIEPPTLSEPPTPMLRFKGQS